MKRDHWSCELAVIGQVLVVAVLSTACRGTSAETVDATAATGASRPEAIVMHATRDEAPRWTVRYGDEFWRRPAPSTAAKGATVPAQINLGDVIDRVSHALERRDATSLPSTRTATYAAAFDGHGLRFSPNRPAIGVPPPDPRAPHAVPGPPQSPLPPSQDTRHSGSTADPDAEVRIRTARLALGGRDVYRDGAAVSWSVLGNTAQCLLDPSTGLVEHYELHGDGVEIAWVLTERPPAGQDLVVDLAIDGLAFAGQTEHGVHYADDDGTARVRFGVAEVVDADGQHWPVLTELEQGLPRWRVPADILAIVRYPIALDPTVSAEFGVDEPVAGGGTSQSVPAIASNGTSYLVVWQDDRNGTSDIYGTLVSTSGIVSDPVGFAVSTATSNQYAPAVASNGTDYLVAWYDSRSGPYHIYATRVTAAGAVSDGATTGLALSTANGSQYEPAVASNGTDYLVVWYENRSGSSLDIYGTRVTAAGAVSDGATTGLALSTATLNQYAPAVASNGTDYLVAWQDARNGSSTDIYGTRVTAAGAVSDGVITGLALSTAANPQSAPAVASNGTDYLVVWYDQRSGSSLDIYGTRVTTDGVVSDGATTGLALSTATSVQNEPAVASDGTDYLVVWQDGSFSDIYGTRVTAAGAVSDGVATGLALSTATNQQVAPAVAFNGTDYLVVWQDYRGSSYSDIYGTRVTTAGAVSDGATSGLAVARGSNREQIPTITASSSGYLVAWTDHRNLASSGVDIYGARLSATGVPQDLYGIALSTATSNQLAPAAASNGTDYFVAWQDERSGSSIDIYGTRVTAAGVVSDGSTGLAVSTETNSQNSPAVASNGTDYLVAWQDERSGSSIDIYGTRVTVAGVVSDGDTGLALSTATSDQTAPAVSSNGTDYLVAWQDSRNGLLDIYGTRVTAAGTVIDGVTAGLALSTATASQLAPAVASNGADYLVAWQSFRSGPSYDIYGTRVTAAGAVTDGPTTGFAISAASVSETAPALAGRAGLPYLITYESRARVAARLISSGPVCGDGALDPGEECDDGAEGDGCSSSCMVELGYTCAGTPSICTDIDECAANNGGCSSNATCSNTVGSYSCACNSGYTGDGIICSDVDECLANNGGCAQTCTNTTGSFGCSCSGGYTLDADGHSCNDIDECATGNGGCAQSCANTPGSFNCSCGSGYALDADGHSCDDIDECAANNGGCNANATCMNTVGSSSCACNGGYTGNGVTCTDVNECLTSNGGCSQTCNNTAGSYACSCTSGYMLGSDATSCNDIDECATNNGGCALGVICTNTAGSFTCGSCPAGYTGDGVSCTDVDECATANGGCAQTCTNTAGLYTCSCGSGYVLNENVHACDDVDECADGTAACSSNADCTNTEGSYTCTCANGFIGDGTSCTPQPNNDNGCGCRSTRPANGCVWLVIVGLVVRRRRRRLRSRGRG